MNLNQVTLPCTDLNNSIQFYKDLGLKLIVHSHNKYARFECPNGESTFSLHWRENIPTQSGINIYFEIEDLDNKVEALKANGMKFIHEPKDQAWLWREAKLLDPAGNEIILYHAGENRKNPPWRLK